MSERSRDVAWHRGLDRKSVAAEALRILDEEGRTGLTMRRLAASLGVEAASLYAHVASKDDLVDAVLDSVLDSVILPEPDADARASLVAGFTSYRRTLVAHPSIVILMTERARFFRVAAPAGAAIDRDPGVGRALRTSCHRRPRHADRLRPGFHPSRK